MKLNTGVASSLLALAQAVAGVPVTSSTENDTYQLQITAPGRPFNGKLIAQIVGVSSVHTTFTLGDFSTQQDQSLVRPYNFTIQDSPVAADPGEPANHQLVNPSEGTQVPAFYANLVGGPDLYYVLRTSTPPDPFATGEQHWQEWKLVDRQQASVQFLPSGNKTGGWALCSRNSSPGYKGLVWLVDGTDISKHYLDVCDPILLSLTKTNE